MESKLVSYIIPIWVNSKRQELESSLLSLQYENDLIKEIIIVFDGFKSFDFEFFVPKIFKKKITYIYCGINKGPGIARNKGAIFAKSKYLFFLDAGDLSISKRIFLQSQLLEYCDVCFGNIKEIFPSGKARIKKGCINKQSALKVLPFRNPFNNVTMAIKKDIFLKLGGYGDLRIAEDWLLMGKILKNDIKISNIESNLVNVYLGNDFLKRRTGDNFYKSIKKCLNELYELKLFNKYTLIFSLSLQFILRKLFPTKFISLIYKVLRD